MRKTRQGGKGLKAEKIGGSQRKTGWRADCIDGQKNQTIPGTEHKARHNGGQSKKIRPTAAIKSREKGKAAGTRIRKKKRGHPFDQT